MVERIKTRPNTLADTTENARSSAPDTPQVGAAVGKRGISISLLLSLSLGALILVTVVSVLSISLYSGISSTLRILERQATRRG